HKAQEYNPDAAELVKSVEEVKNAISNKITTNEEFQRISEQAFFNLERNPQESIDDYLKLTTVQIDNETIYLNLSVALIRNKEFKMAKLYLQTFLNSNPHSGMAHHYLSIANNLSDEYDLASENLFKSLQLKPSLADVVFNGKNGLFKSHYEEENVVSCNICNNEQFKVINVLNQSVSSINYNIINPVRVWKECTNCGLVLASPRPNDKTLKRYSNELYLNSKKVEDEDFDKVILESNTFNERLNNIEKILPNCNELLDLNPNTGVFLSISNLRGWNTFGVENNKLKVDSINSLYNLDVTHGELSDYLDNSRNYDVITLWECLEKIPDFKNIIEKISKKLNKGGVFAFSFHGKNSPIVSKLGKNYPSWYYPDYLYFFDTRLIKKLVEELGFSVVNTQIVGRKYLANVEFY
ncbi:MAG: methyltransferase domain-containing protein, partial [Candidatus Sericytochromatia bacterium]